MAQKVAVVTGSNKGIGFAIVRALCKQYDGDVFLTSRDEGRGKEALKELEKEGLHPKFHQMDVNNAKSVEVLRDFLQKNYNGLDVLINNAAIAYTNDSTAPFAEQAEVTLKTNYFDTLTACEILFPILRPHARVVSVSSMMSSMTLTRCSDKLKTRFTDPTITMEELSSLMKIFVQAAQDKTLEKEGFPESAYGVSKIGVTVMSLIQQKELDKQGKEDVVVNACCPGYVDTDMSSHKGHLTIDQGAETPVYLALLPAGVTSPRGNFVEKKQISKWAK
uniref:carbonyl reductase (NADPH) n=1 Tax=Arion vulgaris TaxID=1028688 RepID=A0A0B7ATQ6_9EUPU